MPELPDLTVYCEHIARRAVGTVLSRIHVHGLLVLRTAQPPVAAFEGRTLQAVRRIAKQVVLEFDGGLSAVLHLMVLGRLHWKPRLAARPARDVLAAFEFAGGVLVFTESARRKRAALHLVEGADALAAFDPGGLEVAAATPEQLASRIRGCRHTLKRALTDQRVLAGIGNAYSDEILLRARLSPFALAANLDDAAMARLDAAIRGVLAEWTARLREECDAAAGQFPTHVTAFRPGMGAHGRWREPCPQCGAPIQRIVHADNESNYCAQCQTGGRLLADRAFSRLLHDSWPKRLEDLEGM